MRNCTQKISFLFLATVGLGFLLFNFFPAKAASLANPQIKSLRLGDSPATRSVINITMKIGERQNFQALNGSKLVVWSNSSAVQASLVNSNTITVVGKKNGQARVSVCSQVVNCAWINVTIGKNITVSKKSTPKTLPNKTKVPQPVLPNKTKNTEPAKQANKILNLSQKSVTIEKTGTAEIEVIGTSEFKVKNDSPIVRTVANKNVVTFYGIAPGNTEIEICDNSNSCAMVYVRVLPNISGGFKVGQKEITMESGGTYWLNVINGGNLSVISSNEWLVTAEVRSNLVFLTASPYRTGNAIVKVCSGPLDCRLVYITVNSKPASPRQTYGSFKSITIETGQSVNVPFPSDFVLSYKLMGNPDQSIASININANNFTITGKDVGSAVFELCPTSPGYSCGTIGVTVARNSSCGTNAGMLTISDTSVTMERSQTFNITASNCTGLTALSYDPDIIRAAVNGNQITLYATQIGQTEIKICDATGTCVPAFFNVVLKK